METISMVREGNLDSRAVFTAPETSIAISFDRRTKLAGHTVSLWRAMAAERELESANTFGAFNERLAAHGLRIRFAGGGKGSAERVLQLIAETKEALNPAARSSDLRGEESEAAPDPADLKMDSAETVETTPEELDEQLASAIERHESAAPETDAPKRKRGRPRKVASAEPATKKKGGRGRRGAR